MAVNPSTLEFQKYNPPSSKEIERISKCLGFQLNEDELHVYQEQIASSLSSSYERLRELPDPKLPVKYPRDPGYRPAANENPFNAWYWKCEVKGAKQGKLHGRTVVLKDSICLAGVPMMIGSRVLEGYIPEMDASVVTRVLDAGGTIVGKAVCEDLCWSAASYTSATGPVRNPHDETRMTGGSSSGCAALLAAGLVDMAIGGDQGGSIRIPASRCGIVGLKPTHGLVPYTGAFSLEPSIDHLGPMARTVYDVALLLEVIAGYDGGRDARQSLQVDQDICYTEKLKDGISGLRVGILKEGFEHKKLEHDVDDMVRQAAQQLALLTGVPMKEISVPMHKDGVAISTAISDFGIWKSLFNGKCIGTSDKSYQITSLHQALQKGIKARANEMSEDAKLTAITGKYLHDQGQYLLLSKARNLGRMLEEEYDEALQNVDVLVLPTTPMKAKPIPPSTSTLRDRLNLLKEHSGNCPFNITGHPAVSIPVGLSQGLPVGMLVVGRKFDESTILRVAYALEKTRVGSIEPRK
ncbi:uncharacterized protein LOC116307102 [Actinia tenebrosa]|uniref:Uncharacterized protein LOC116307102 n=1 Tax=Actinia tenebrosa TaxID=6105 RepID=A0A6P8J7N0_ACTTE|nr:uncharacterized protein LOC116307102 [Actinia tenebrosa]